MQFNNLELRIHGLASFTLHPMEPIDDAHPVSPCLSEIADVTSARMEVTGVAPSDQTATLRLSSSPLVERVFRSVPEHIGDLLAPLQGVAESVGTSWAPVTALMLFAGVKIGDYVWVRREKLRLQSSPVLPTGWLNIGLGASPYGPERPIVLLSRGQHGTRARSVDMVEDIARSFGGPWPPEQGIPIYRGGPRMLTGCAASYWLHRVDGTSELLLDGVIRTIFDAGDTVQVTIASDIESVGQAIWPRVDALPPYGEDGLRLLGRSSSQYAYAIPQRLLTTASAGLVWNQQDDNEILADHGSDEPVPRRTFFSAGPVGALQLIDTGADPDDAELQRPPINWEEIGKTGWSRRVALSHYYSELSADPQWLPWRAIALLGTNDDAGLWDRDAMPEGVAEQSDDRYTILWTELIRDNRLEGRQDQILPTLGMASYRITASGTAPLGAGLTGMETFQWRDIKNGAPWGSVAEGDELYTPCAIFNGTNAFKLPAIADFSSTAAENRTHWEMQHRLDVEVAAFKSRLTHTPETEVMAFDNFRLLIRTARRLGRDANDMLPPFYEAMTSGVLNPARDQMVWPAEYWHERAIKDTYFSDARAMLAVVHVPAADGLLRPLFLGKDLHSGVAPDERHITVDNVRERDHTVMLSSELTLSRVEFRGLPTTSVPRGWIPGADGMTMPKDLVIVSSWNSDEGVEGEVVTIRRTPLVWRYPERRIFDSEIPGYHDPVLPLDIAHTAWSMALENYGKPLPRVTLRVDRRLVTAQVGDTVDISLPNMAGPRGIGVERMRGQVWERGERVGDDTAELMILLVGWHEY